MILRSLCRASTAMPRVAGDSILSAFRALLFANKQLLSDMVLGTSKEFLCLQRISCRRFEYPHVPQYTCHMVKPRTSYFTVLGQGLLKMRKMKKMVALSAAQYCEVRCNVFGSYHLVFDSAQSYILNVLILLMQQLRGQTMCISCLFRYHYNDSHNITRYSGEGNARGCVITNQ